MRLSGPVDLESLALFVEFVRNVTTKKADDLDYRNRDRPK